METTTPESAGSDGQASPATSGESATGTRRKLTDAQEQEVTRLYAATDTPVSEISKRFGIGESSVYRVAQRHGAALRGRTATSASSASTSTPSTPATPATAPTPVAATPTPTRGTGRRAGRPPGSSNAARAAAAAAAAGEPAAAPTNGRRTRGAGRATGRTRVARATPAVGGVPATRGRGPGRTPRAASTPAPTATLDSTPAAVVVSAGRREFRVSFVAVRVFAASDMADAIRQAEAAGATDITGIQRND